MTTIQEEASPKLAAILDPSRKTFSCRQISWSLPTLPLPLLLSPPLLHSHGNLARTCWVQRLLPQARWMPRLAAITHFHQAPPYVKVLGFTHRKTPHAHDVVFCGPQSICVVRAWRLAKHGAYCEMTRQASTTEGSAADSKNTGFHKTIVAWHLSCTAVQSVQRACIKVWMVQSDNTYLHSAHV